jgi:putative membrane protein
MQGNLAEIELGRLAITHSTSPVTQGLGTRVAQDGSRGVANLQAVAGLLHVELPARPSADQERQLSELAKLEGARFDARFQQIALTDEQQFLRSFQSGVSRVENQAVKSTVKDMIPVVQEHIQIAQAIPNQYPQRSAEATQGAPR